MVINGCDVALTDIYKVFLNYHHYGKQVTFRRVEAPVQSEA